jgi:hypothetical protein
MNTMSDGLNNIDLGIDDPDVIALAARGKITADDMARLIEALETRRAQGHKARLYIDLSEYCGYELPVVKEKLSHMGTLWKGIAKCAYVVDKGWMTKAIGLVDTITPMHLRAFTTDERAAARAWIIAPDDPA